MLVWYNKNKKTIFLRGGGGGLMVNATTSLPHSEMCYRIHMHNCIHFCLRKCMVLSNIIFWVKCWFFCLVTSDGVLQGDPVPCERCGGNGNYLSSFELKNWCTMLLCWFVEIIKALCQEYDEHFKILGARISLFMCINTGLIWCLRSAWLSTWIVRGWKIKTISLLFMFLSYQSNVSCFSC